MAAEVINNNELASNNNPAPAEWNNNLAPAGRNNNQPAPAGGNNNQPPASSGPTVYSGSNMTSEAAALFEMAALMQDLNVENGQISVQSTELQNQENKYEQETTIEKGHKQALTNYLDMGSSLTSAALSGAGLVADYTGKTGDLGDQLGQQQGELKNLENMQTQAQDSLLKPKDFESTKVDEIKANETPEQKLARQQKDYLDKRAKENPSVERRINELKNGQLDKTTVPQPEPGGLDEESMTGKEWKDHLDKQSFDAMTTDETREVKGQIDEQVGNKYKAVEKTSTQYQASRSNNKMVVELGTQVSRAGFDGGKAYATAATARQEALLTSEKYSEQVEQTIQQNELKLVGDNRSTMDGAFSALVQGASRA